MELLELILLLLICVVVSSALDQMISRVSLPLIQIAVGFIIALVIPHLANVYIDSEVFMMLFIAPLLFREAKESDRVQLWKNKTSVLSMAIALVIASVLIAGFALHWIIPSIPLAAAFACAAALGPTDAAAVSALGSTISLNKRQSTLLSGEALINDASGVVSFEFAIAAAVTGAFSLTEAIGSFAVLFFGGIAVGLVLGFVLKRGMLFLRRRGYVNTTMHVIYEVLSPFLLFLVAEELHVSGILAVVAAGLLMQEHHGNIVPAETAQREMVSNSFWEVIIFLINGVIFVMLGMQLPKVLHPEMMGGIRIPIVFAAMFAVTALIIIVRWFWLIGMGLRYKNPDTGVRGIKEPGRTVKEALVTTIAGPKGAVTLSIIMTIPLTMRDGSGFPQRDLIIFLTSGVILLTLLVADILLPVLSPKIVDESKERKLKLARIRVLEGVISEIRQTLDEYAESDYAPAARLALMRYRRRLMHERLSMDACAEMVEEMAQEITKVQQARADEIQKKSYDIPVAERAPFYALLREIRASLGYFGGMEDTGAKFESRKGRIFLKFARLKKRDYSDDQVARTYYDTCLFAIELEHAAIDYLKKVKEEEPARAEVADILLEEHEASLQSLWGRIHYGQEYSADAEAKERELCGFLYRDGAEGPMRLIGDVNTPLPEGIRNVTGEQFVKALQYADEVDATVLEMELNQIRRMRFDGELTETEARALREEVYLMQTSFFGH